jgi:nitrite reductase (NO-forming)
LPPVDREYYVMQGEFYTTGKFGAEGLQTFDLEKATDERPTYVVFNGSVGSLVGDKAITANVGETVRLYVGNGGPNLLSSFHVIGEIFDLVYPEGGTDLAQKNVQTTLIPAGGSTITQFKVEVPGTFILVDHSLSRAFGKGALGMLKVAGAENLLVYSGKEVDSVYLGRQAEAGSESQKKVASLQNEMKEAIKTDPRIASLTKEIQIEKGKQVFLQTCFVCHQVEGQGIPAQIPPLAKSDFLMADKDRSIRGVLMGQSGEMLVNGKMYNGTMIPLNYLGDEDIAHVLTFVRNSWGNVGDAVTVAEVRRIRSEAPPPPSPTEKYE